jgi:hypothetical protein
MRFIAKGFLAGGFLLGIDGLTEGRPVLLRSGLALVAVGVVAMIYGLYRALTAQPQLSESKK